MIIRNGFVFRQKRCCCCCLLNSRKVENERETEPTPSEYQIWEWETECEKRAPLGLIINKSVVVQKLNKIPTLTASFPEQGYKAKAEKNGTVLKRSFVLLLLLVPMERAGLATHRKTKHFSLFKVTIFIVARLLRFLCTVKCSLRKIKLF